MKEVLVYFNKWFFKNYKEKAKLIYKFVLCEYGDKAYMLFSPYLEKDEKFSVQTIENALIDLSVKLQQEIEENNLTDNYQRFNGIYIEMVWDDIDMDDSVIDVIFSMGYNYDFSEGVEINI